MDTLEDTLEDTLRMAETITDYAPATDAPAPGRRANGTDARPAAALAATPAPKAAGRAPRRGPARGRPAAGALRIALPVVAGDGGLYLTAEAERAISNRLSRLEGQVRGVNKMLAEHKSCDEMLVQISALKQAVNAVAAELLQAHMETCVLGRVEAGEGREALASLRGALAKVLKHG